MKIRHLLSLIAALGLISCGSSEDTATEEEAPENGTTALTLDNCTTTFGTGVPSFFKKYFKCVTVSVVGTSVKITSKGLPPHKSYYYGSTSPNYEAFDTTRGAGYSPNPNKIATQSISFSIPTAPVSRNLTITSAMVDGVISTNTNEYTMGTAGVALDSVALFNPLAAPGDDIEKEKYTFDIYNAHPAPMTGAYHYHTVSAGPLEVLKKLGLTTTTTPGAGSLEVYGIMCDGTPVLGCKDLDGSTPTGLDSQGGHLHEIKDSTGTNLFVTGQKRYHTHVCPSSSTGRKYMPEIQYYSTCNK